MADDIIPSCDSIACQSRCCEFSVVTSDNSQWQYVNCDGETVSAFGSDTVCVLNSQIIEFVDELEITLIGCCGSDITPTPTPTQTNTPTPTITPTPTNTPTPTSTGIPDVTPTPTPTLTETLTESLDTGGLTPTNNDSSGFCCPSVYIIDKNVLLQENLSSLDQEDNSKIKIKK